MKHGNKLSPRGLTLIELLLVMAIIGIMSTFAISTFVSYSKNQKLVTSQAQVATAIAQTRSLAQSQIKPTGCVDVLNGYRIYFTSTSYTIKALCGASDVDSVNETFLTTGITIASPKQYYQFDTLTGIVSNVAASDTITISQGSTHKTIKIYRDGTYEAN